MSKNKNKDLRINKNLLDQSEEIISKNLVGFKKELFNLRFQQTLGELKDVSKFSKVKKNIARIKTELTRRSLLGEK